MNIKRFVQVERRIKNSISRLFSFSDDYVFEAFLAEAIIQNLISGQYVDISDVRNNFRYEHFKNIVVDYCNRYGRK